MNQRQREKRLEELNFLKKINQVLMDDWKKVMEKQLTNFVDTLRKING